MADENKKQAYVWPLELRENKITERTDDYTASVKTFSDTKSLEYIAKEIVRERTEYRLDTILNIEKLVAEKIRHFLYSGYSVMTENVRFSPTITGSFDSHGELLDDKSMKCGVNVTVNQIVKDGLAGVKLYIDSVQELGGAKIDRASFPTYDPAKLTADTVEIPVQLMGKLRGRVTVAAGATEADVLAAAKEAGLIGDQEIVKTIYVPDKILNVVVRR